MASQRKVPWGAVWFDNLKNKSGEKTATCHIHLGQFPCWIQHGKCWTRHHSSRMPYREKWKVISCRDITCNTWWCHEKLVSNLERIVGLGINEDLRIRGMDLYVFPCNLPVQHTFIWKRQNLGYCFRNSSPQQLPKKSIESNTPNKFDTIIPNSNEAHLPQGRQ